MRAKDLVDFSPIVAGSLRTFRARRVAMLLDEIGSRRDCPGWVLFTVMAAVLSSTLAWTQCGT